MHEIFRLRPMGAKETASHHTMCQRTQENQHLPKVGQEGLNI